MVKLVLFLSLLGLSTQAWSYACPESSLRDKDFGKGIAFLKSVEGSYKMGACQIEIRACDPAATERSSSNLFGEIFIKDKYNREQYAPLYFQEDSIRESKPSMETYNNSSYYVFRDRVYDDLNGGRESIYLDLYKDERTGSLGKVSLGIYGTKRRVTRYWLFHTSQWSVCEVVGFKR